MTDKYVCISGTLQTKSEREKLKRLLEAEIKEIEKYKWELGVSLCRDPLEDKSINEICLEWICKYAAEFRYQWDKDHGNDN